MKSNCLFPFLRGGGRGSMCDLWKDFQGSRMYYVRSHKWKLQNFPSVMYIGTQVNCKSHQTADFNSVGPSAPVEFFFSRAQKYL